MGWYVVVKTIKGRGYYYRQRTWREGGRVRCHSVYIGPVASMPRPILTDGVPTPLGSSGVGKSKTVASSRLPSWLARLDVTRAEDAYMRDLLSGLFDPSAERSTARTFTYESEDAPETVVLNNRGIMDISVRMKVKVLTKPFAFPSLLSSPFYRRSAHMISMPDASCFRSVAGCSAERLYYATLMHECVHATMIRFDRPPGHGWRKAARRLYAREEIVAELAANMIVKRLGVAPENSALARAYLAGWGRDLSATDMSWAIARAREAADYLTSLYPASAEAASAPCKKQHSVVEYVDA